ncbi:ATP-dependent DNA ligase [Bradyrhizobium tropiciagri]|uniref:ATP-dependent DNA ligase n=1 Tax=Bradyrhizobium tropiciagri TaxID=312253 RepID=UPI001BA6FC45|nr:ATP-dependent DNA ligase [Bradyrhizobium tropiciagri]MBR0875332.1 ATP-dependent DNA ligase [Bradyrhizobium tropiciagri]
MKSRPTIEAMEALSVEAIPIGEQWLYEPKWDGFRCLLKRDGRQVDLQSKSGQKLNRYFPEIIAGALTIRATSFVLDGELVVQTGGQFSFDGLLQRIHPAASRVKKLAAETPALFLAFDLLKSKSDLASKPLFKRRPALEDFAARFFSKTNLFRLSPASTKLRDAQRWLAAAGGGSDGVIAKRLDLAYQAGNREGMQKIKRYRSADCVIAGFRYGASRQARRQVVGSLLLGLYDDDGLLHHVGYSSGIKAQNKPALTDKLEAIKQAQSFTGNAPGGPSRWSTKRSSEWQPIKPKFVVEVSYDHFTGGRFRHGTSIMRWRPDKKPRQCTFEQVRQKSGSALLSELRVDGG